MYSLSSNSVPRNVIENVDKPSFRLAAIDTIELESIPPLRKLPSGTSLMSCIRTASSRSVPYSFANAVPSPACGANVRSQYGRTVTRPPAAMRSVPGSSCRMPSNSVLSPNTFWNVR